MRIGLIGHAVKTGVGYCNRDLWDTLAIDEWLVVRHPQLGIDDAVCPGEARCCGMTETQPALDFLDSVDVVALIEQPPMMTFDVMARAKLLGKLVVCVPMVEWLPAAGGWLDWVDVMWAPTQWSARVLESVAAKHLDRFPWQERIWGRRWGIHVDRFQFTPRESARTFLFVNGHGGVHARKGIDLFAEAARLCPSTRFIVRSQTRHIPPMPGNVQVEIGDRADRASLYDGADVLVAPSRWEGFGMQLYEAPACGLGVITTAAGAMNESPYLKGVCASQYEAQAAPHTIVIDAHEVSPADLAASIKAVEGIGIGECSMSVSGRVGREHDLPAIARDMRLAIGKLLVDQPASIA